jgi:serine protease Do
MLCSRSVAPVSLLGCFLWVLPAFSFAPADDRGKPRPNGDAARQQTYLGVGVVAVDEQSAHELGWQGTGGLLIAVVQPDSPAEKAGLQPNDIVSRFNGEELRDPAQLGSMVAELPPGRKVHLEIFRNGKLSRVAATLAARQPRPGPEPLARFDLPTPETFFTDMPSPALRWRNAALGIEYEGVDSQLAEYFGVKQGVLIRSVIPGSTAQDAGLKAGDVVTKANGKTITNARDFALALQNREHPRKQEMAIDIVRQQKRREMKLKLPAADSRMAPWTTPNLMRNVTEPFSQ